MVFMQSRSQGEAVALRQPLAAFPTVVGEWQGQEGTLFEDRELDILRVTDYVMRRYVDPTGQNLWLFIGYWDTQRRGAQPHSPKHCLPGGGWEPLEAQHAMIPLNGSSHLIPVNRYLIQKDQSQQLVLYWYHSQGKAVASEVTAKLQLVKNSITRNRTDGALIRITSPVVDSVDETFAYQVAYVQALYPRLKEFLPE
jgi:EpsI family protein